MEFCNYHSQLKCDKCDFVLYKECSLFKKAHVKHLIGDLLPFNYVAINTIPGHIKWGKDINKVKMSCANTAVALNSKVRKLTLSQVLAITLESQEITDKVLYIELSSKIQGDIEKVIGVLKSFLEKMSFQGAFISIYVGVALPPFTEYSQIL